MVWRRQRRPRTEARVRRQDDHSRGLTPDGPLRKPGLFTSGKAAQFASSTSSPKLVEQSPRVPQVRRVEALGEPSADRGEQIMRLSPPPLVLPETGEARRGAQLPQPRTLGAGNR